MPITKIQFQPGFDKQNTDISSKGKWTDGDKVRFRYGYPEKMGGWEKISTTTFIGVARAQLAWNSLDGTAYDIFGTNKNYMYIVKVISLMLLQHGHLLILPVFLQQLMGQQYLL